MSITITIAMHPEDNDLLVAKRMLSAEAAFDALDEIRTEIFRPARKHGYEDPQIKAFIEEFAATLPPDATDLDAFVWAFVGLLEAKYQEILRDHSIIDLID